MTQDGLAQAIAPAYTRYIGAWLLEHIASEAGSVTAIERLEAAANTWYAAPIGSVAETDAAGEMYDAIQGLLAEVAPGLGEAA